MALKVQYEKLKTRVHYATIPARDPHDGGEWDLLLSPKTLEWAKRRGMGACRELADTVRWAVMNPKAIFQGVRDLEREISEDGWLCYAATPSHAYNLQTGERVCPAWRDEVFLVYVNEEREIYLSYWGKCDAVDGHLPIDYEGRFTEKVWP